MLRRIEKKKERRKKFMMGAVLVFLMIFSVMGILIGQQGNERLRYNDFKFFVEGNVYFVEINKERKGFNFFPSELEEIPISQGSIQTIQQAPMFYLTFDPELEQQDLVYIDVIRKDLTESIGQIAVNTMTQESETYALPIITCENATPFVPVMLFNHSNNVSIEKTNNCVVMNGKNTDFLKLRDLLMYKLLGVMN